MLVGNTWLVFRTVQSARVLAQIFRAFDAT